MVVPFNEFDHKTGVIRQICSSLFHSRTGSLYTAALKIKLL